MKKYLLDNGVLVAYVKGRLGAVQLISPWIVAREVVTCMVVYGEAIEYFMGNAEFARNKAALQTLMVEVIPLQLTYAVVERYAEVRRAMRPPYGLGLIGDIDTLIAATAMEEGLTVVTLDGDFTRIPGLTVMRLDRAALQ